MAGQLPGALAIDYGGVSGPDWYAGAAARIAAQARGDRWIAVLHSGAGGFAPALATAAPDIAGLIFVDAVLPYPGHSWLDTAPPALADRLRRRVIDGRLAPWNQWFDEDAVTRLIPEASARAAFIGELPRMPFDFLEAVSPADPGWKQLPAAYVQLSGAYDSEAAEAQARGWAARRARLNHLAMLSDPDKVAALLSEVCASLSGS